MHKKYLSQTVSNDTVYAGYSFFDPNSMKLNFKPKSFSIILLPFTYAYRTEELKRFETINVHSAQQDIKDAAIVYNAWQIMTSIFSKNLGLILDIMMNMCDEDDLKHLDDDLDKLNNIDLVARFFEAVSKKEIEISCKWYTIFQSFRQLKIPKNGILFSIGPNFGYIMGQRWLKTSLIMGRQFPFSLSHM